MGSYNVEVTQVAEEDIIKVARYIAQELCNRDAANKLIDELYKTILSLGELPHRHKVIVDDEHIIPEGIRKVGVKNYDIYYSCDDGDGIVYIRRVLYVRREWQKHV